MTRMPFGKYAGGLLDLDDGIDEAVIRLDPGMQWQAEIADIGFVTGTHEITLAEVTSQPYNVRKRGARTLLTGGVVSASLATRRSTCRPLRSSRCKTPRT